MVFIPRRNELTLDATALADRVENVVPVLMLMHNCTLDNCSVHRAVVDDVQDIVFRADKSFEICMVVELDLLYAAPEAAESEVDGATRILLEHVGID